MLPPSVASAGNGDVLQALIAFSADTEKPDKVRQGSVSWEKKFENMGRVRSNNFFFFAILHAGWQHGAAVRCQVKSGQCRNKIVKKLISCPQPFSICFGFFFTATDGHAANERLRQR